MIPFFGGVAPDPSIKPIPLWLRVCFWAAGAGVIFAWFTVLWSPEEEATLGAITRFSGVVFLGVLFAMPNISLSLFGILLMLFRKPEVARHMLAMSLRWTPRDISSYLNHGYASFRMGAYHDCIQDMTRVLEVKPRHFHALFHRGTSYYMLEDHEKALLDLSEAARIRPQHIINRVNLGNTYNDSERYDDARRHYEAVLEHKPKHFVALANIGSTYADEGQHAHAVKYYNRALAANPQPTIYCNRGLSQYFLGNEAQAEEDFARGFERKPGKGILGEDEVRFLIRGKYRLQKGNALDAREDFQTANEMNPSRKDTLAGLAAAHLLMGHPDAAHNIWNLLVERDPRFADRAFVQRRMQWPEAIISQIESLLT